MYTKIGYESDLVGYFVHLLKLRKAVCICSLRLLGLFLSFQMILLANTFVWLSLRNLAFLRLGKRWPELGSSTWVVAVPSLLSRFPFSQTFSGFKNTFGLEKKSHSTKSLKRESSGKLYIGQAF